MGYAGARVVSLSMNLACILLHDRRRIAASDANQHRATVDPIFAGCGRTDLDDSYQYGLINQEMHVGMAINFTGNPEYDFLAGMIPHHRGAVDMCEVYLNSSQYASGKVNTGIQSLCYNITYGAKKWGPYQSDFSQVGEAKQMTDVLDQLHMLAHYEKGCKGLTSCERYSLTQASDHSMFMGCGDMELNMTKQYIHVNMQMHQLMALNFTADADVDFLLGMIPHHQAALKMCDIYYENWACAPSRNVCRNPLPANEVQMKLSRGETVSVLNQMKHMCTDHIMVTQPPEIEWMIGELERISPQALEAYQNRDHQYPCSKTHRNHKDQSSHSHTIASNFTGCESSDSSPINHSSMMEHSHDDSMEHGDDGHMDHHEDMERDNNETDDHDMLNHTKKDNASITNPLLDNSVSIAPLSSSPPESKPFHLIIMLLFILALVRNAVAVDACQRD